MMDWGSIKDLIGKAAPVLGTVIAGPAGASVGALVSAALGVENTPEAVEQELRNNPDALLKLKQLELDKQKMLNEHLENMANLDFKHAELKVDNLKDARELQSNALKQGDKFSKRFIYLFAIVWSIFAMIYLFCITFIEIPAANTRFSDTVLGFLLGTIIASMFQFFYGTSDAEVQIKKG